jgi:hypothetical protein
LPRCSDDLNPYADFRTFASEAAAINCVASTAPHDKLLEQFDYFSPRGMTSEDSDRGFGNTEVARQQIYKRQISLAVSRRFAHCGAKFVLAYLCDRCRS